MRSSRVGTPVSRRVLLTGSAAVATLGVVGAGLGIEQGLLPGRPWLQEHLGLNGTDGVVPDVAPGPVTRGSFVSRNRLGTPTSWVVVRPPGAPGPLPVVVALPPLGRTPEDLVGRAFGLDRFLAAAVAAGTDPFVIAAVDGGTTYWHRRPNGEDAGAMLVEEFLPLLERRHLDTTRIGLMGWSMGGYGVLRLAGLLGPDRVGAVVAASPALWSDPGDASDSGFADAAEYERFTVFGHQADLDGIPLRVDCGTGDPFYRDVQEYLEGFGSPVSGTFEPGGHEPGYWRRMLPAELRFLGDHLGEPAPE